MVGATLTIAAYRGEGGHGKRRMMERADRRAESTALAVIPAAAAPRQEMRGGPLVIDLHPAFERLPARAGFARPPRRRRHGVVAVGLGVAVLAALVGLRRPIVEAVPPLGGVFAAIGLPVNLLGVELDDVTASRVFRGGYEHLRVEGAVVSVAAEAVALPPVEIVLVGSDGAEIDRGTAVLGAGVIAAGGTIRFAAEFADPPAEATGIAVRLGDARPFEVR
jgi:hypothetical protein